MFHDGGKNGYANVMNEEDMEDVFLLTELEKKKRMAKNKLRRSLLTKVMSAYHL